MLRRLLSLGAAALAAVTSACEDGPATVTGTWRSPATWSSMVHASASGPLLVEIHGVPFRLPASEWHAAPEWHAAIAEAMTDQIIGRRLAFSAAREAVSHPEYRVVLAFNPPDNADAGQLCAGRVAVAPEAPERIAVLAAFCGNGQLLASVRGWVAKVDGPADRRFRHLLGQITRELFGDPA